MPRFPKNLDWTNATIVKTKEQTRNGIFIVTTTDITTPPLMTNWDFGRLQEIKNSSCYSPKKILNFFVPN